MRKPSLSGWMTLAVALGLTAGGAAAHADDGGDLLVTGSLNTKAVVQPHPGMTSDFFHLVQDLRAEDAAGRKDYQESVPEERVAPLFRLRGNEQDEIEAYISLADWSDAAKQAVEAIGVEIVAEDPDRRLVQAWVPLDVVEALAESPYVQEIRRPSYGIASTGSIVSQGDGNLNANFVRQLGQVDGSGIRVGVISHGLWNEGLFSANSAISSGTNSDVRVTSGNILPDPTSMSGSTSGRFGSVRIFPPSFTQHIVPGGLMPEGAAVLETLFDVAPGAEYFYAKATTTVEMQVARNFLLSNGVDVIVDTVVFYDAGRFDGSSTISRRAQQIALTEDVVYITATGNQSPPSVGPEFYTTQGGRFPFFVNGYFSPNPASDVGKFHNFAEGRRTDRRVEGLVLYPVNGVLDIALVWDDVWSDTNPRATDDLDLYLVNPVSLDVSTPFASSTNRQDGAGRPFERITIRGAGGTGIGGGAAVVINRRDQSNNARTLFTLMIFQGQVDPASRQYLTHGIAGNNGDALAPVLTTGGIDATDGVGQVWPATVPGTNPGPGRALNNDFVRWYEAQVSPAVMSYTNTFALSAGPPPPLSFDQSGPFSGSSAAAAHLGGLVTLMRHSFRQVPSWAYYDLLRDTSPPPVGDFPSATSLQEEILSQYKKSPRYLRVNGFDAWANIRESLAEAKVGKSAFVSTVEGVLDWEQSDASVGFTPPVFGKADGTLTLSPGGNENVFGFLQTPVLEFPDGEGGFTSELDPDGVYLLTVRVGSDEPDPKRVPHFRLRLMSGGSDQAVLKVVAGVHAAAANPPTTVAGREYKVFYRPSNEEIAKQGVRFAFDLVHFLDDKNSDATLFLQELSFRKVDVQY